MIALPRNESHVTKHTWVLDIESRDPDEVRIPLWITAPAFGPDPVQVGSFVADTVTFEVTEEAETTTVIALVAGPGSHPESFRELTGFNLTRRNEDEPEKNAPEWILNIARQVISPGFRYLLLEEGS
jgi:hypothetical protein